MDLAVMRPGIKIYLINRRSLQWPICVSVFHVHSGCGGPGTVL